MATYEKPHKIELLASPVHGKAGAFRTARASLGAKEWDFESQYQGEEIVNVIMLLPSETMAIETPEKIYSAPFLGGVKYKLVCLVSAKQITQTEESTPVIKEQWIVDFPAKKKLEIQAKYKPTEEVETTS